MTVNEQDILLLSAYIDGELTEPERISLEARLEAEADLGAELDALQQTVRLVREMPTLRAPRDYTLDPAKVGARRSNIVRFRMRAITYAAAAIGVALVGVTLLLSTSGSQDDAAERSVAQDVAEFTQSQPASAGEQTQPTSIVGTQQPQPTQEVAIASTPTQIALPTASREAEVGGQGGAAGPEAPPEPQQEVPQAQAGQDAPDLAQANAPALEESAETSGSLAASDDEADGDMTLVTPYGAHDRQQFGDDTLYHYETESADGMQNRIDESLDDVNRDSEGLFEIPDENEIAAGIETEVEPGFAAEEGAFAPSENAAPPNDALGQAAPSLPDAEADIAGGREERFRIFSNNLLAQIRDLFAALLDALR